MDSTGLLLAAVATGSDDMPSKDPLPVVGTAEQAAPNGSVPAASDIDGEADGLIGADIDGLLIGADELPAAGAAVPLSVPQAAKLSGSTRAAPRAASRACRLIRRVVVVVMSCSSICGY